MAIIEFEAISANLFASVGDFKEKYPVLSFRVRLAQGESMNLTSGEMFGELDGQVTVFPETTEAQEQLSGFGTLRYFAAIDDDFHSYPPNFIIQAALHMRQFEQLLSAAKLGRIPSEISVDVEGMEYDWRPDGSGKKWDNKASPRLPVNSVRFSVPLVCISDDDSSERHVSESAMPATRLQMDQLMQRLDSHSKTLRHIFWAVVVLGGLMILAKW
jgi:hypothetical protein